MRFIHRSLCFLNQRYDFPFDNLTVWLFHLSFEQLLAVYAYKNCTLCLCAGGRDVLGLFKANF